MGREALESSIPDLQSGALPSKLPAQSFRQGRPLRSAGKPKKKARRRVTPGLVAHLRVGPSVISACYFRSRAHNPAVHSPFGQMWRGCLSRIARYVNLVFDSSWQHQNNYTPPWGKSFVVFPISVSNRHLVRAKFQKSSERTAA